jgi:PKD repeat protein
LFSKRSHPHGAIAKKKPDRLFSSDVKQARGATITHGGAWRITPNRAARVGLALVVVAATLVATMPRASAALTAHQRQIAVGGDAVSSPTFSLSVPSGVSTVVGRHLVVAYLFSGAGTNKITSIADSGGNTYTINAVKGNSGTTGLMVVVASAKITSALVAGDTITVTQNVESTYHAMQVYEFDNFASISWVDKTATGSASGTAVSTAPTAMTAVANETLFAAVGFGDTTATLTSAPDWSDAAKVEASGVKRKGLAVAAKDVAATGEYAYSGTLSASEQWVVALVTFKTVQTSPVAPAASFSAAPTSGAPPLAVQFTDTSTGGPTAWAWTFGDGTSSAVQSPTHIYTAAGTYSVTLTVTNSVGTDTVTKTGLISVSSSAGNVGYPDGSTSGAGAAATGEKPESKLWWNDGSWQASMFDAVSQTHHIFRLDRVTDTWVETGTLLDNRPKSRSDVLWDGAHLYVASHVFASSSSAAASGNPARLYRLSYDPATRTYSRDAGFPVQINNYSTETLTIDKDSTGVLWATWVQGSSIYVNSTTAGDAVWGTPFVMPTSGATGLDADDISAVAAFGGNRIGVMWSNQVASAMYFAAHVDGAARNVWETSRTAVQGPNSADDHINLKQLQGDPSGRVFAAVKTGLDDAGATSSAPQILILARDRTTGDWSSYPFGRIGDCHTRPVLMLDSEHQILHVFATAPDSGCPFSGSAGTIFEKTSPMNSISFPLGRGTPVIRDASSPNLNNVTSSKQNVTSATGLVVLASNDVTKRYWHADIALGAA